MQAFGVLRTLPPALSDNRPDRDRHLRTPARHEAPRRHPVDDLIHRIEHEVETLMDEHWPQPGASRPRSQRRKSAFGNRCVEHALRAKTFDQARRCSEDTCLAVGADPVDENAGIKLHRLPLGNIDRLSETQARAARTRLLGNGALSRQHVQNGPGRASDCPPPKLGVTLWVKRVTTFAYSPDQLLEMTLRMSAKPARLAEAIAVRISASTSRSMRSSSLRSTTPSSRLRITTMGSRAFQRWISAASR